MLLKESGVPDFNGMMATARQQHRQRNIVPAAVAYRNALALAVEPRQVRKALSGWAYVTNTIRSGRGYPTFNRIDSLEGSLLSEMNAIIQDTSRPPTVKAAAKEQLAHFLVRKRQHAAAAGLFAELSTPSAMDSARRPRMLYDLVATRMFGLNDAQAARSAYQTLETSYPDAKEVPLAKVILHLPLTPADINLLKRARTDLGRDRDSSPIPTTPYWSRAYPNPFNPVTTIEYHLPDRNHVRIAIFSSAGMHVGSILDASQDPGTHRVSFDGSGLPSGVYRYRIELSNPEGTTSRLLTGSIVLVK